MSAVRVLTPTSYSGAIRSLGAFLVGEAVEAATATYRLYVAARREVANFMASTADTEDCDYRFGEVLKDPEEELPLELDLYELCASFWRRNEEFSQGEFIRPNRPTGFSYEAINSGGGTSGAREPVWPTTIDASVADGSITWACRAASGSGLNAISAPSVVSDPVGLTISSVSVSESRKILATYSSGTEGEDYDAVFTFTLNGLSRVARQTVKIRKR